MSSHGILKYKVICQKCEAFGDFEIELFSSLGNQFTYDLGDIIKNITKKKTL
jgi:hypothetical protein